MNISDAAVEAAAIAMEDAALSLIGSDLGTVYRNDIARAALEAAAPHLMAAAWEEGRVTGFRDAYVDEEEEDGNPYRAAGPGNERA